MLFRPSPELHPTDGPGGSAAFQRETLATVRWGGRVNAGDPRLTAPTKHLEVTDSHNAQTSTPPISPHANDPRHPHCSWRFFWHFAICRHIPQLRTALETIIFTDEPLEAFEVDHDFPSIGRRTMVLNARRVSRSAGKIHQILLAIEDVTERARLEREHALARERVALFMQELTHRVKNSLQSIAAMVMIEARVHKSSEGKAALERVSHRMTHSASSMQSSANPTPLRRLMRRRIWTTYVASWSHQRKETARLSSSRPTSKANSSQRIRPFRWVLL